MLAHAVRKRKKVSVSLAADIVKHVVAYQKDAGLRSFSAAVEELLWRHMIEEQAREHYQSMPEQERAEQRAWARFATEQFFKIRRDV